VAPAALAEAAAEPLAAAADADAAGMALMPDCRPARVVPSPVWVACAARGSKLAPTRVLMPVCAAQVHLVG